ncbi:hypothetical protein MMSR116_18450 [Methylobacterium mesophilicum SR1.6/6]|uniref:Uncharacterized protein n=1 Tax=Methylobacterium mesophilicum SR1.6/6 TaxID=908290 RepID=A0A6B9FM05_9HYPH|nr:hypothetical protein MMSR116_18450 [Methylobacterium mesophilicum SR1.6/6]
MSNPRPHPEVLRSSLEGGLPPAARPLEGSFEAFAPLRHFRMRERLGFPSLDGRGIEQASSRPRSRPALTPASRTPPRW